MLDIVIQQELRRSDHVNPGLFFTRREGSSVACGAFEEISRSFRAHLRDEAQSPRAQAFREHLRDEAQSLQSRAFRDHLRNVR